MEIYKQNIYETNKKVHKLLSDNQGVFRISKALINKQITFTELIDIYLLAQISNVYSISEVGPNFNHEFPFTDFEINYKN